MNNYLPTYRHSQYYCSMTWEQLLTSVEVPKETAAI